MKNWGILTTKFQSWTYTVDETEINRNISKMKTKISESAKQEKSTEAVGETLKAIARDGQKVQYHRVPSPGSREGTRAAQ